MLRNRNPRAIVLAVVVLMSAGLACGPLAGGGGPSVTITGPPSGTTVTVGQEVQIVSTAAAEAGVARVDLSVNGQVVRADAPPSGNPTTFPVSQSWTPAAEGDVTISVVAYDVKGVVSEPATLVLHVGAGVADGGGDDGDDGGGDGDDGGGASPVPEATSTPVPDVVGEGGCTLNSSYVTDVTVPDDTEFAPGAAFVKTWRIRNSGTCDWTAGFNLVFVSGDQMGGQASVAVPATAAGSTADLSVNLTAPGTPGTYRGDWRLQSDEGLAFGSQVYTRIVVPEPTPEPTETPTEEPTPEPTEAPTEEATAPPTNLQADVQADNSVTFTWDDATGEVRYDYEISFAAGMTGAAMADEFPADTTEYDGGIMGCGGHGSFYLTAIAEDDSEIGELSVTFDTNPCPEETVTLEMASRGQIEQGEDPRGGVNNVGDTGDDTGLQGFITFDVSSIPDVAIIESAKLETIAFDTLGDPFDGDLGALRVYVDNYGVLDDSDYTPPVGTGSMVRFSNEADMNDPNAQTLNAGGIAGIEDALESDQFQIRLQFNNRHTDNDGVADVVRPRFRLVVTYRPH